MIDEAKNAEVDPLSEMIHPDVVSSRVSVFEHELDTMSASCVKCLVVYVLQGAAPEASYPLETAPMKEAMDEAHDLLALVIAEQRASLHTLPAHDRLVAEGMLLELEARIFGTEMSATRGRYERIGRVTIDIYSDNESVKLGLQEGIGSVEVLDRARDAISDLIGRK